MKIAAILALVRRVITEDCTVATKQNLVEKISLSLYWKCHTYLLAQEFPIFVCYKTVFWKNVVKLFNHYNQTKR